ncbi:MAG: cell envelope integrity EipB family protein [Pseudolabrys sp.]|nr:cell envelope integrity EipB family protein [Pseudolabrys sp.]
MQNIVMRSGIIAALLAAGGVAGAAPAGAPPAANIALAPHRAVYDLKLSRTRGSSRIEGVRGRILYDFSGSSCAGYELQFRQVSELDSGEGKTALSDLRSSTWEDATAKSFRFSSENRLNNEAVDVVNGDANRKSDTVAVSLHKPSEKSLNMPTDAVFPTEHMRRIIAAAKAGEHLLQLQIYDGSETGEKIYQTLTVIGAPIAAGDKPPNDASANEPALAKLRRWPVTISYFEKNAKAEDGDQTPAYSIGFELYENGVSRALSLDYSDFTITGEMTSLEMKKPKVCN